MKILKKLNKVTSGIVILTLVMQTFAVGVLPAFAADTGFFTPSSNSNNGWANPGKAYVSDNQRAVANSGTDVVEYSNFGLSIPTGSSVDSIVVQIEGYTSLLRQANISLSSNGGATYTSGIGTGRKITTLPGITSSKEAVRTYGNTNDKWNHTWSPSDFSGSNFKIKLDATIGVGSLYIDQLSVKVYYTPAPTINSMTFAGRTGLVTGGNTVNLDLSGVTDLNLASLGSIDVSAPSTLQITSAPLPPITLTGGNNSLSTLGLFGYNILAFELKSTAVSYGGIIPVTGTLTGATGNQSIITINIYVDIVPPVITLVGPNPDSVLVGSPYVDPGATAFDIKYGDLTSSIIPNSNVDTSQVGSYTITYDVSDAAGNAAITVTRTVNVIDTTAPVISLNGSDTINVVYGTGYLDQGATATDNFDPSVSVVVTGDTVAPITPVGTYYIYYDAVDTANNHATQITRTINVTQKPLAITANDSSKTYGDTLAFNGTEFTSIGLINSDTISNADISSIGQPATAAAMTYSIDITAATGTGLSNYTIIYTAGTLTVNKVDITVTADNQSKVYGTSDPDFSTAYRITSGTLFSPDTLSGTLDRVSGESVGTYQISGDLTNPNYTVSFEPGSLTITKAHVLVIANTKTKVFGQTDPKFTYNVIGLIGSDFLTGVLSRPAGETVGSYQINQGALAINGNYTLTFTPSIFTITARPLTTTTTTVTPAAIIATTNTDTVTPPATDVLGDQTTTPAEGSTADKTSDTPAATTPDNNIFNYTIFGIYDWIWLIGIAGALGGWWFMTRRRDRD